MYVTNYTLMDQTKFNTGLNIFSTAVNSLGSAVENARLKDTSAIDNAITERSGEVFDYGDYDALLGAYNPTQLKSVRAKNLDDDWGSKALNIAEASISGAMATKSPWGLLAGVPALAGGIIGDIRAKNKATELNKQIEEANQRYLVNFANNAEMIGQRNFNSALLNMAAYGGILNSPEIDNYTKSRVRLKAFGGEMNTPYKEQTDFSNGVIKVDEGQSHEMNPYGGVLMGVDPQGTPNLVEEGEVIFRDYVFSNRLSPTEAQLEEVKLPKKYADKPFSRIAEKIQEESEIRPLDSISKNTLIDQMSKLTTLQEHVRQLDNEYNAFAEIENAFAEGGEIHIKPSKRGTFTAAAKKHGMGVQEFASKVLANKENYSPAMVKKANFARNAAKWHAFGGQLGNMFAGTGNTEQWIVRNGELILDPFYIDENLKEFNLPKNQLSTPPKNTDIVGEQNLNPRRVTLEEKIDNGEIDPYTIYGKNNNDTWRFAPIVGSGIQALNDAFGWDNKEDYTNPNIIRGARTIMRDVTSRPIGNRMSYTPFDLDYEQNRLQNYGLGVTRSLLDVAGGNREAARNAMLAYNRTAGDQLGDLYRKAREYNDARRNAVEQFNASIDQFNSQQGLQSDIYNQRRDEANAELAVREAVLRDNIESTLSGVRSNNVTNFWNNLGNYGRDRYSADQALWSLLYRYADNEATRNAGFAKRAKGGKVRRVREFKTK